MINILIDTNSLVYLFENKSDVYRILDSSLSEPYRLHTIDACVNELKSLKKREIVVWLAHTHINTIKLKETAGKTDDKILDLAAKEGYYILSEDRGLINRALESKIPVIKIIGKVAAVRRA